MFGRILISLISCVFCDLRARLAFFWASYLYLPTSRNLATGGSALGETSTRSRPTSAACSIASAVSMTPRFSPFSSITRTLGETMNSLKRGPFMGGACGRRARGGRIVVSPEADAVSASPSEERGAIERRPRAGRRRISRLPWCAIQPRAGPAAAPRPRAARPPRRAPAPPGARRRRAGAARPCRSSASRLPTTSR